MPPHLKHPIIQTFIPGHGGRLNKALIQGTVVKTYQNQGSKPHLRVVVDVYYRPKGAEKNWKELFTVVFWGTDGDEFLDKAQLGSIVEIEGTMRQSSWTSPTGAAMRVFQIHATTFKVIGDQAGTAIIDRPDTNGEVPF